FFRALPIYLGGSCASPGRAQSLCGFAAAFAGTTPDPTVYFGGGIAASAWLGFRKSRAFPQIERHSRKRRILRFVMLTLPPFMPNIFSKLFVCCFTAALVLFSISGWNLAAVYTPADNFYNIKTYGAKGDGKTLDTNSVNKAIDAAAATGGGTVFFPAGTYLC